MKRSFLHLATGAALVSVVFAGVGAQQWERLHATTCLKQVQKDWDELVKAMAAYGGDRCGHYYPADTVERRKKDPSLPLTYETMVRSTPVPLARYGPPKPGEIPAFWQPLTTPIAYAKAIPNDPFRPGKPYGYTCWNYYEEVPPLALIHSPGPDGEDDVTLQGLRDKIDGFYKARPRGTGLTRDDLGVIVAAISPFMYDPTNGLMSRGDLILADNYHNERYSPWAKSSTWEGANLPDVPWTGEQRIPADWKPGEKLPPSGSVVENMRRNQLLRIPQEFALVIVANRWATRDKDGSYQFVPNAMSPLQNRLGRFFADVIEHPRPLNYQELAALAEWMGEAREFWGLMEISNPRNIENPVPIAAADLYAFLPIYGKAQFLLAARDAAKGEVEKARARLELGKLRVAGFAAQSEQRDMFQERVQSELTRLYDTLGAQLDTGSTSGTLARN